MSSFPQTWTNKHHLKPYPKHPAERQGGACSEALGHISCKAQPAVISTMCFNSKESCCNFIFPYVFFLFFNLASLSLPFFLALPQKTIISYQSSALFFITQACSCSLSHILQLLLYHFFFFAVLHNFMTSHHCSETLCVELKGP